MQSIVGNERQTWKWPHREGFAVRCPIAQLTGAPQVPPGQAWRPEYHWENFCRIGIWSSVESHPDWGIIERSFAADCNQRRASACYSVHPGQHHNQVGQHHIQAGQDIGWEWLHLPRPDNLVEDWPRNWGALGEVHWSVSHHRLAN